MDSETPGQDKARWGKRVRTGFQKFTKWDCFIFILPGSILSFLPCWLKTRDGLPVLCAARATSDSFFSYARKDFFHSRGLNIHALGSPDTKNTPNTPFLRNIKVINLRYCFDNSKSIFSAIGIRLSQQSASVLTNICPRPKCDFERVYQSNIEPPNHFSLGPVAT